MPLSQRNANGLRGATTNVPLLLLLIGLLLGWTNLQSSLQSTNVHVEYDDSERTQEFVFAAPPSPSPSNVGTRWINAHVVVSGQSISYDVTSAIETWDSPLILGVLTAASYTKRRKLIRETWGKDQTVLFLVASPSNDLYAEMLQHRDMLILNMTEVYQGEDSVLPFKVQVLFHAAHKFAVSFDYLLKTDDDSFVNVPKLTRTLADVMPDFWGYVYRDTKPVRDKKSKWFVSKRMFDGDVYPPYCGGAGYVMSRRFTECAVSRLSNFTYTPNEDVATGILAHQCGVAPIESGPDGVIMDYKLLKRRPLWKDDTIRHWVFTSKRMKTLLKYAQSREQAFATDNSTRRVAEGASSTVDAETTTEKGIKTVLHPKPTDNVPAPRNRRCLEFVHITKTGGTLVELVGAKAGIPWGACKSNIDATTSKHCEVLRHSLGAQDSHSADPLWHDYQNYSRYRCENLFTVVRNPYSRMVSEFYCPFEGYCSRYTLEKLSQRQIRIRGCSPPYKISSSKFNAWLQKKLGTQQPFKNFHGRDQHSYVFDSLGNRRIKHVLHQERLDQEFNVLMEEYDLSPRVTSDVRVNTACCTRTVGVQQMTPETIAMINKRYAKDFEDFGYDMMKGTDA